MTGFRLAFVLLAGAVAAEQSAWSQCGGKNYHGETSCVAGYTCVRINDHYSQCQAGKATASLTTVVTPPTKPTPSPAPGAFRFLGRVNPATKELTWPGTGISFTFTGTSATIGLASVSGESSVELTVDGNATVISKVSGTSISTPQLSQGIHTVSMRKRSEAYMGSIVIGTVTTNGTLKVDAVPKRQVEIIGDSITVGYGLDGVNPCTNNAEVENNPKTYAALAASALGADYNVIAWSGKGVIRNYPSAEPDTSPIIPQLWTRYAPNDADGSYTFPASWNPEAVVINLGTNDFNYIAYNSSGQAYRARENLDPKAYTNAMVKFVQTIKSHYKKASFFLLNSPMMSDTFPTAEDAWKTTQTNALKDAIAQLNGTKAYLVDWPSQGSDVGCDYHPNAATNAAEAKVLQAAIAAALRW